ncbi:hypothetical protein J5X07_08170 [Actinomyces bowdenii]|uniref:variant leucine-rich repeat-containing protein n=1 Tax=Actinomyces bowdenii TaxID=131109 RepID=UPI001ABC9144|nr:hypothetical protein [Actinomyces bowdenii]MBO3725001.1 hypothetical protein [Actinomyces bowdenii]
MATTAHRPGARDRLDLTAAQDPRASAGSLMVLAGNRPELRPAILANPACSPELREWIARMPAPEAPGGAPDGARAEPGEAEDSLAPFGWEPCEPGLDEEPFGSVLGDPLMGSPLFEVVPSWEEDDDAVAARGGEGRTRPPGGSGPAPAAQPPAGGPGRPPRPAPMVGYAVPGPAGPQTAARPAPARPAAPPPGWPQTAPGPQTEAPPGAVGRAAQSLGALMQQAGAPGAAAPLPHPADQHPAPPWRTGQGPARMPGTAPTAQGSRIPPAALGIAALILFGVIRSCAG